MTLFALLHDGLHDGSRWDEVVTRLESSGHRAVAPDLPIDDDSAGDCPEPLARRAFDALRHQSFTVFTERCPIDRWPDVFSTYVLMREDRAVGEAWARRNACGRDGQVPVTPTSTGIAAAVTNLD